MLSFESDYIMGAHPKILESLIQTNLDPQSGYGCDMYSRRAAKPADVLALKYIFFPAAPRPTRSPSL